MYDLVALGELLIDFTPTAPRTFYANPGGAPANVLAACANMGLKTAFIGKVGQDDFGRMLQKDLAEAGVGTEGLIFTQAAPTTLAFVQLDERGDRSFTFVRKPGADTLLCSEEVDYALLDGARAFHFGSVSMTDEPSRTATLSAAAYAKNKGLLVSYDPNLRPPLWQNTQTAKEVMLQGLALADIVKVSEEEVEFLTGAKTLEDGAKQLLVLGPQVIFTTLGPKGCLYVSHSASGTLPTYDLPVADTTGAGDAFMGGILTAILESKRPLADMLSAGSLAAMADFANAVGSLATTKPGGIRAMPRRTEVTLCMQTSTKLLL